MKLREADRIPADHLNGFFQVLVDRTAKRYPDYSCLMVMKIARTLPDPAHREKVYQRAITVYGKRPDGVPATILLRGIIGFRGGGLYGFDVVGGSIRAIPMCWIS